MIWKTHLRAFRFLADAVRVELTLSVIYKRYGEEKKEGEEEEAPLVLLRAKTRKAFV